MQVGEIMMKAMSAPQLEPATRGQKPRKYIKINYNLVFVTRMTKQHSNPLVLLNYSRHIDLLLVDLYIFVLASVAGSNCGALIAFIIISPSCI